MTFGSWSVHNFGTGKTVRNRDPAEILVKLRETAVPVAREETHHTGIKTGIPPSRKVREAQLPGIRRVCVGWVRVGWFGLEWLCWGKVYRQSKTYKVTNFCT
jgi:hypothetical protein